jgi:hypothetical protein
MISQESNLGVEHACLNTLKTFWQVLRQIMRGIYESEGLCILNT